MTTSQRKTLWDLSGPQAAAARQNQTEPNTGWDSLDAIRQNDEADDDAHDAIQKPNIRMILVDFSTDQDGKSHDAAHQRVKSCRKE